MKASMGQVLRVELRIQGSQPRVLPLHHTQLAQLAQLEQAIEGS